MKMRSAYKPRPTLTPEERRGQELLSFNDLHLFGIRYTRSHIYNLIDRGEFPSFVRLSKQRVAFARSDVEAWIKDKIKAAHSGKAA